MRRRGSTKIVAIGIIILVVVLIGVVGFFGFKIIKEKFGTAPTSSEGEFRSSDAEDDWQRSKENENNDNNSIADNTILNVLNNIPTNTNTSNTNTNTNSSGKKVMYKGYEKIGTIKIPKTNIEYPILAECTKTTIEMAVAKMYGPNPNEVGVLTLVSHNYKNATLFSNNKKLSNGDAVYITDLNNNKVKYVIYDKFETTPEDTSFMMQDSGGKKIIALSTCTDDSKSRLILMAQAEEE